MKTKSCGVVSPCKSCGVSKTIRARGMCCCCYDRAEHNKKPRELTDAELDAVIAQQMRDLPPWWESDVRSCERDAAESVELPAAAVVRGRRLSQTLTKSTPIA